MTIVGSFRWAVSPSLVAKLYFAENHCAPISGQQWGPQGRPKTWKLPVNQEELLGARGSINDASGRTRA